MKKIALIALIALVVGFVFFSCDTENGTNEVEEFTVKFDLDGGNISSNTAYVEIKVISGGTISNLPNPQKGTDTFGGWFTQKDGAGTQFTSTTLVTADLTVFAKWIINDTVPTSLDETSWGISDYHEPILDITIPTGTLTFSATTFEFVVGDVIGFSGSYEIPTAGTIIITSIYGHDSNLQGTYTATILNMPIEDDENGDPITIPFNRIN